MKPTPEQIKLFDQILDPRHSRPITALVDSGDPVTDGLFVVSAEPLEPL